MGDAKGGTKLTGVYDADGSVMGELRYVAARTFAGKHCALCDITHGRVREKAAWRQARQQLPVPFEAVHLDERDPDVRAATEGLGACVVVHSADGGTELLLGTAELKACGGDPERFVAAVREALDRRWPAPGS